MIPTFYVLVVGVVQTVSGPSTAGLVSTFPSMSLVVLAVTHLEAGAAEASRIARFLPAGNLSTLAFLAAFCWGNPVMGLGRAAFGRLCGRGCDARIDRHHNRPKQVFARRGYAGDRRSGSPAAQRCASGVCNQLRAFAHPTCARQPASTKALDARPAAPGPPRGFFSVGRDAGMVRNARECACQLWCERPACTIIEETQAGCLHHNTQAPSPRFCGERLACRSRRAIAY